MIMYKIPFGIYDFFGYLASGFVVMATLDTVVGSGWLLAKDVPIALGVLFVLLVYIVGHLVAHLSSAFLEQWFVARVIRVPEEHMLAADDSGSRWARLFGFRPLPGELRERITRRASREGISVGGGALFLHADTVVKNYSVTLARLSSFLSLYGFCRNISVAALIAGGIFLFAALRGPRSGAVGLNSLAAAFVSTLVGIGMFLRYLKFLRHYAQEVLLAYASAGDEQQARP